jgi:hypothetical protein
MTESEPHTAERLFEQLATRLLADPAVRWGTGFGSSSGLRVGGKTFAMLSSGELVVKLPKERVDRLVGAGLGARFDPRHDGRLMREWATIPVRYGDQWEQLARQALQFVRPAL